jgi:hypothetical protein
MSQDAILFTKVVYILDVIFGSIALYIVFFKMGKKRIKSSKSEPKAARMRAKGRK